jgi:endoglucanase
VTTDSDGEQWQSLAQELVETIRAVDENHLLVVGGVYGVEGRFDPEGQERHFLVDDENVMHDFHFYEPYPYTHQYAPWVDPARDGGTYPDPDRLVATIPPEVSEADVVATSSLPEGTSGWTRYDSGVVTVEDPSAVAALPQFVAEGRMDGTARVDGVTVTEYGPDGTALREVLDDPMDRSSTGSWNGWGDDDGADPSVRLEREPSGRQDDGSLSVGAEHGVPLSVMEFGAVRQTFEMPGKGGDRWVGDVLGLLAEHDLSFGYWEYHDPDMGIFVDEGGAPDEPSEALLEVLRRELHEGGP